MTYEEALADIRQALEEGEKAMIPYNRRLGIKMFLVLLAFIAVIIGMQFWPPLALIVFVPIGIFMFISAIVMFVSLLLE